MKVQEVRKKRRRAMPSQAEIKKIRTRIEIMQINLETGSVLCKLDGEVYRLQRVETGKFCIAFEPRNSGLATLFALRDEAFAKFDEARLGAKSKPSVPRLSRHQKLEKAGQLLMFPIPQLA